MKSKRGCLRYLACLAGRQTVFSAEGLSRGSLPQHSQRTTVIGLPYAYVFCYLKPSRVLPAMSGMPEMEKLTPTNFVHQETGIPLTGQKLVYKGSVLHTGSVQECGIAEDDFVVVVVVRAVAAAVPPESGPVPASVQQVLESSRSCPAIKSARVSYVTLSCARCGGVTCSFAERSVELTSYLDANNDAAAQDPTAGVATPSSVSTYAATRNCLHLGSTSTADELCACPQWRRSNPDG
eukprot:3083684-Rhodomonas_salina.2